MPEPTRTEGEPHDRMTRITDAMLKAMKAHPEYTPDIQAVVMIGDDEKAGTALDGYENDAEALAAMFAHLAAIFRANGKKLIIAPMRGQG